MPSVASQVAASIAQHRDAKVSAAASNNDRAASSPFAEMLDSTVGATDPAPKTSRSDKHTATPAKKSSQADDAPAKHDSEPSAEAEPAGKDASPAKADSKDTKSSTKPAAEAKTEPEDDTVAEAAPAEPDAETTDVAAFIEAVAAPTTPEASNQQAKDETKPADADADADAQPADTKAVAKADAAADAAALPVPDVAVDTAPAGDAEVTGAAKAIGAGTAAAGTAKTGEAEATQVDPALAAEKTTGKPDATKPHDAQAEPAKQDASNAKADGAHHAQAHGEQKAAHAHRSAEAQRTDAAEAKPAATEVKADAPSSAKPADLPPPTQPLTHAGASATSSIQGVTPQKDVTAPATAVPVEGVAVEIASKALEGKNRFEIRLDPPELGRIHVRLDVDRNGEITSRVMADRQDTLDLLRREAPQLERALSDAGLRTAGNGLQFTLRDHGQGQGQHEQQRFTENTRLVLRDESLAAEAMPRHYSRHAGQAGGLDIRV